MFTFKKAKDYMFETGASFLITGEVVGQRPMSQKRHTLRHIEKETGLDGLILRPLSARLLNPSIPEQQGWVDRNKFLNIQGRSRKPQFQLADNLNVKDYPCPSGGCLLTDPGFAKRAKDLIRHNEFTLDNINLVKSGRFFRIKDNLKIVAGRNEEDNNRLLGMVKDGDVVFKTIKYPGPIVISRGVLNNEEIDFVASIAARYSDANGSPFIEVEYYTHPQEKKYTVVTGKCEQALLEKIRI